jgi:hypothetical protein
MERWLTKTVHGSARYARGQLEDMVAEAGRARIQAGTLADLLDQWFQAASHGWAASTVSHTRSIIECTPWGSGHLFAQHSQARLVPGSMVTCVNHILCRPAVPGAGDHDLGELDREDAVVSPPTCKNCPEDET